MSRTPPARMRPIASLPLMPTVPSEPLLLATTATLPLSDLISEAAPAGRVISACEPRYCCALLRRSPETHGMP